MMVTETDHTADFDLEPPEKEVERYCSERASRQRAVGDEAGARRTDAAREMILSRLEKLDRGRTA